MQAALPDPALSRTQFDRGALLRTLADGRPQTWNELAAVASGQRGSAVVEQLRLLLSTSPWLEMALAIGPETVRAAPFVLLDADELRRSLGDRWHATVVTDTASTSAALLERVRCGEQGLPAVFTAEIQEAGRGRFGRRWNAVPGASLTVSFALPVDRGLARLHGVTLVCGLAVRRVLAGHGVAPRLKWPNDVLVDGRKVAGILVETQARPAGTVLVVGIGVNLTPRGDAPGFPTTSLAAGYLAGTDAAPIDRNRLAGALGRALEDDLKRFDRDGFAAFARDWNAADAFRGEAIALHGATGVIERGIGRGVDEDGALLLESNGQRRRFVAGEVSLRPEATGATP